MVSTESYRGFYQPCGEKDKEKCISSVIRSIPSTTTRDLYEMAFRKVNLPEDAKEMKLQIKDTMGTFSEELVLKLNADNPCGTELPKHVKFNVRLIKSKVETEAPSRIAFATFNKPLNADCKDHFKEKYQVHPKNKKMLVPFSQNFTPTYFITLFHF